MKTLIVLYSRTGTTLNVGRQIQQRCEAALHEIKDPRSRAGVLGFLRSAVEAARGRTPPIQAPTVDLAAYDLIVLGSPVWAGHMSSPMRTFIAEQRERLRNVALFCAMGGSGQARALQEMAQAAGVTPLATLAVAANEVNTASGATKVEKFAAALRGTTPPVSDRDIAEPLASVPASLLGKAGDSGSVERDVRR